MSNIFIFLFSPVEAVGHIHACIGIGQQLIKRGHKVIFATPNTWRGKFLALGFEEEYIQDPVAEVNEKWGDIVAAMAPALALPIIDRTEHLFTQLFAETVKKVKDSDAKLREIMERVKPDLILIDNVLQIPSLMNQGIPWVFSTSLNPLGIHVCDELPPGFTGYSILNKDRNEWKNYSERFRIAYGPIFEDYLAWLIEKGGPELEFRVTPFWQEFSPYANIYMTPEEMAYTMYVPNPPNWHRFDCLMREEKGEFEIPREFESLPGKLIYFSLGSIGACELKLMRKLLGFLAKSPHRFIVSKGPIGDELELADNMWGANNLPQTLVLPKVDLVITHGGNNTVTECFYFGKPMICLPLIVDQLDNATRVEETGHGLQFEPYHVTEAELLAGIETLLNNKLLKNRMDSIGIRIRAANNQGRAADLLESVAQKCK